MKKILTYWGDLKSQTVWNERGTPNNCSGHHGTRYSGVINIMQAQEESEEEDERTLFIMNCSS